MNIQEFHDYCMIKKGSSNDFPFDPTTQVFRVMGKIFALTDVEDTPAWINLKCDPTWAIALRQEYKDVNPGYHMNKKHWNTVVLDGDVPDAEIKKMIDHSYELIVNKLTKKEKTELEAL